MSSNYILIGYASLTLIVGLAIPASSEWRWVGFSVRLTGVAAGIAYLSSCDRLPSKIEQRLKEEADKLAKNRVTQEEWIATERQKIQGIKESLEQERIKIQNYLLEQRKLIDAQRESDRNFITEAREKLNSDRAQFTKFMEQERQRLKEQAKQDLAMLQERLQRASESLEIEKGQIARNTEALVARYEREIASVKQQNQQLIEQLRLANYPIPPKGIRDIDIRCHRIQHIFWRSEIVLDCSKEEPMCDLSKEVFLLYPRDSKFIPQIIKKSDEFRMQLEALFNDSGAIKIDQVGAAIRITYDPKGESLAEYTKKS